MLWRRTDGKTVCRDTFAGYTCECGSGFISHTDARTGKEECLDINECLATDPSQLSPDCSCDRCACQNVYGGYKWAPPFRLGLSCPKKQPFEGAHSWPPSR